MPTQSNNQLREKFAPSALSAFAFLCAVLGLLPLANLLTSGHAIGWWGGAVREWMIRGSLIVAIALGVALLAGQRLDDLLQRATEIILRPSQRTFALGVSTFACTVSALLAQYCFAGQPFTSDEMAQLWHARILLSGRLMLATEARREFFNTAPVIDQASHWFSQYPVGGPAFIAIGLAAGAAWLVNPVLLGFATWQTYRFTNAVSDELTARSTTLLFMLSPMVLIMAASQMNHVPALAFTMFALASLTQWDRAETTREQWLSAAAIGFTLGIVAAVRPLDAALVGVVIACYQLWRLAAAPERWRDIGIQCAAASVPLCVLFWANARTTGSPFLFGYDSLNGLAHRIGFHLAPNGQIHTPLHGVILASGYLMRLDRFMFEWPIPALVIVLAGVAGILATKRASRWDVVLAAVATAFLVGYGAYWFDGFFAGPRFLFTTLPVFVYFAARAPRATAQAVSRVAILRRAALVVLPLCVLTSWLGPFGISSAAARVILYRDQRTKLKTDIERQIHTAGLHHALVFVNESWRGRLLARLRVYGVQQFEADRIVSTVDACALQTALDAEDTLPTQNAAERRDRVLTRARSFGKAQLVPGLAADQTIALVPGSAPTPACVREVERDAAGSMPYALFLAQQQIDADGRIGGDVVFARDFGPRDELLRARFGDRVWYRYRPPRSLADTAIAFVPYLGERGTANGEIGTTRCVPISPSPVRRFPSRALRVPAAAGRC
ncbi:MAG TPA: phospholipid carrier-dependent glycosyltransferase [Gemmatimonadaceae bacterium]|nr:phospholipid carrier-dependent glycosyltransferase [Gemmatimonadaceae bacterium]